MYQVKVEGLHFTWRLDLFFSCDWKSMPCLTLRGTGCDSDLGGTRLSVPRLISSHGPRQSPPT